MSTTLYIGADMSFDERQSWVYAIVMVAVPGWYFLDVLGRARNTPISEIDYQPLMLWNIGIVIVATIALVIGTTIAAHIRAAVASEVAARTGSSARDAEIDSRNIERRDERDVGIDRFGGYVGGYVLAIGALVPLGLAMLESEPFWIANALYAALVGSALASSAVKLIAYRRGS